VLTDTFAEKGRRFPLLNVKEFCQRQNILKKKQKQLQVIGKGNKPNKADALTDEDIFKRVLPLRCAWKCSLVWHEARTRATRPPLGRFRTQNQCRRSSLFEVFHRAPNNNAPPRKSQKMSEKGNQRCSKTSKILSAVLLLALYNLAYEQQRPPEMMDFDSPFYLAFDIEVPKAGKNLPPLGVDSLISIVRNISAASQLHSDKKLVNDSTRKHFVQKLADNYISPNKIVQITGHKNITLLNKYSAISEQQHISAVLSRGQEPSRGAMIPSLPKIRVKITATSTVEPSTSAAIIPSFYQCQTRNS